jgi:nitroreductase
MLEALESRRSVRMFQSTPIPESLIRELVEAVFYAPTANNVRPWHVIVVQDTDVKDALAQTHEWSGFIRQAPVCFVIAADTMLQPDYWIEDCSAGLENLMIQASYNGIGTCWIAVREVQRDGESAEDYVRQVLGAPSHIGIMALVPAGVPAGEAYPRDKTPPSDAVHWDRFKINS